MFWLNIENHHLHTCIRVINHSISAISSVELLWEWHFLAEIICIPNIRSAMGGQNRTEGSTTRNCRFYLQIFLYMLSSCYSVFSLLHSLVILIYFTLETWCHNNERHKLVATCSWFVTCVLLNHDTPNVGFEILLTAV